MIKTFADKRTVAIFNGKLPKGFPPELGKRARQRLQAIDSAMAIGDLCKPPSHRLEKLSGDRGGQWSIRINRQWRVCFLWHDGDAFEAEVIDYH